MPETKKGMSTMSWDKIVLLAQAQPEPEVGAIPQIIVGVIYLAIAVLYFAGLWKTFAKAGEPGWGAIVPFYNIYLICKIGGRPGWWLILFFIPCVGIIIAIIVSLDIAKNFGKGSGFGLGLGFLPFIFFPILGFGDARYLGNKASANRSVGTDF
jgi:Family of unknown function (DUF5684)